MRFCHSLAGSAQKTLRSRDIFLKLLSDIASDIVRQVNLGALWSITAKNTDCITGPLARPFARSVAPLTRSLAPDCSLRFARALRCAHSLARSLRSLPRSWESVLHGYFVCDFFFPFSTIVWRLKRQKLCLNVLMPSRKTPGAEA